MEMVSNNAVAVVITPLAIGIAAQLGMDPRPLVVAVMVAASASFATPIGYKCTDFVKVGIPLNLSIGLLASMCIPWFWPLDPAGSRRPENPRRGTKDAGNFGGAR